VPPRSPIERAQSVLAFGFFFVRID